MIKHFHTAIIGGGASGLFCACMIKRSNPALKVAVIEKQKSAGKKLLATGNGRCNLTNIYANTSMYHGSFKEGVQNLLNICPPDMIINLFSELGLMTTVDLEGRVYPMSRQSNSVLDILLLCCKKYNVEIIYDSKATDIQHNNDTYTIITESQNISSDNIVIATGSKATPETGADDSIFAIIKKLGHTITPLYPALSPVKVENKALKTIKGVRAQGEVSILVDNKIIKSERGEIQFTDKTLSGICVFNLSRIANTAKNSDINISLLPDMNTYDISEMLKSKVSTLSENEPAESLLIGILNKKLCFVILNEAGVDTKKKAKDLSDKEIKSIAFTLNNWKFRVIPSDDFSRAQVVDGGINGNEINPLTMESKIRKNMYIIGEAVDCDGDCGGLNLQFAFSSAYCAACELAK